MIPHLYWMVVNNLYNQVLKYCKILQNIWPSYKLQQNTSCLERMQKKHCDDIICTNEALEWGKKTFKLLGKDFVTNLQNIFDMNFRLKFQHIKINNETWKP